ncbi:hybrid sensor histidine kinase/response regulator transcription factor [uncultured Parabacteroides sp.]|uniref:hybrid sensor histidine kinase/response regulator transcription factor n=1 Tax=uncultured Parabacteroides sp. TaxID=512312 RepID=UPI0025926956|nr:hybrid sensor histidine kinase/response regulator transcription factor [uncultured Parabacteroides sp.]
MLRLLCMKLMILCLFLLCALPGGKASVSLHKANIDLSNNAIIDIYQDDDGYMWIGTYDGLNLFNGRNTYVYRFEPDNKNTLCSNIINKISDGGPGYLWVSTSMGLNRFSLKDRKVTESYPEYPECLLIATDSLENTLVVSRKNFISCHTSRTASFQDIYTRDITPETARLLFAGEQGCFYLLSVDGVLKQLIPDYSKLPVTIQTKENKIHDKPIEQAFYEEDVLYYVDADNKLYRYRTEENKETYLSDLSGWMEKYGKVARVVSFQSKLYLVFRNGLLLDPDKPEEAVDLNIGVFSMFKDKKQQILWIGTDGQGLRMLYDKYERFDGLALEDLPFVMLNPVRSVYTDEDKTLWFGTKGDGFVRIKEYDSYAKGEIPLNRITRYTAADGLSNNRVYCFYKSLYHPLVWIGTDGPGLSYYSYEDEKVHTLPSKIDTRIRYVHSICEINDSTLWMATTGDGLIEVVLERDKSGLTVKYLQSYLLEKDGKICNEFYSMYYDGKSTLYLGSRGGYGMARFDLLTRQYDFMSMNNSANQAIGDVLSLCYSSDSTFYLGASSGMTRMKCDQAGTCEFWQYDRSDGISNDMIHGILEDKDKCIWLSSNKGLTKYNPHNNFFHNYGSQELMVTEFSDDAYWKCPYTGRLFFGGVDGLVWIDPQNDRQESYSPDLHFFELKMGDETISLYDYADANPGPVTIPPDVSTFTISFVATDYIHGDNYEYSYLLQDYNTAWTELQKSNEISFTKLPYGNYTLKVRYKNDVYDSNAREYLLPLKILPPWYLSAWAIAVYILLAILLAGVLVYWLNRRIAEKQQQVARKIHEEQKEKLYEAKLNFFANITHELCTPLTLINGVGDYIQTYAENTSDNKLKRYIRILRDNVASLNELIQEILDFRKIEEAGLNYFSIRRISVPDIIRRQYESFTPIAEQNGIKFVLSLPDQLYWNTDPTGLKKILVNLISNAFKYSDEAGEIRISATTENESLVIRVYNSGKGISETDLKTIFDRYRILGDLEGNNYTQTTSRNGLGLFICHSIVQSLHGTIDVKSEEGRFAEFIVRLPHLEAEEEEAEPENEEPETVPVLSSPIDETGLPGIVSPENKPCVLVVDDNKDIVWLIKESLSEAYTIVEAYGVEEAIRLMEKQTPALIITDIMMPEIDGMELISRVKSDKFTRHIPLIVVSARISEHDQAEGLDLGADAYLTKPFSAVVLRSVVNRLMTSKKELKDYYYSPESAYEQSGGQLIHQEDKEFMDAVTAIIRENLDKETLRLELIAEKMGMNTRSLYRRFKKISPLTPSDFIKDYRFNYAAQLLVTTNLSVQEIIYKVGISNRSYFYREFAAKYNQTPTEYRNKG